jgi:CBS domain-containing protein
MRIRDLMTSDPVTCGPDTAIVAAARLMAERDIGAIPVIDSDSSRRPIGVITDRDITTRIVAKGENPIDLTVRDAMTAETVTVTADTSVEEASREMSEKQVRRLIVVDQDGSVRGMVAQADLALHASVENTGAVVKEISEPN